MRTVDEMEERLRVLTQALYFSHAHRDELSPDALSQYKVLEEGIGLLQWCLEPPDPGGLKWANVGRAVRWAAGLLALKLRHLVSSRAAGTKERAPVE